MAPTIDWQMAKVGKALGLIGKNKTEILKKYVKYEENFLAAINDDLDMPKALSIFWQISGDGALPAPAKKELFLKFDKIFGLGFANVKAIVVPPQIKKLIQERQLHRQEQEWEKADKIRRKIEKAGWIVEDAPEGPKIKPKS
jgi:cysteinyl-tRNA synthetase